MRVFLAIGLVLLERNYQDPGRLARELIDKLSADDVGVREDAMQKLKAMGRAAAPALKEALGASDSETIRRAKHLLRMLEIRETLPAELLREFPGVEDRLAAGSHEWTLLFLRVCKEFAQVKSRSSPPVLGKPHLQALVAEAIRGADAPERSAVTSAIQRYSLHRAVPTLVEMLKNDSAEIRKDALWTLAGLECSDIAQEILPLLKDPELSS